MSGATPSAGGAAVSLEHLSKRFGPPGTATVVTDLSLEIGAGEVCVLVGPSGCGKTTTMRMINRLVEPSAGRVTIGGEDVSAMPAVELRRRIGYVIQQVGLFPHLSVADNVAVVPRLLRWPESRVRARVDELLALVGLEPSDFGPRYPAALSGGERQRIGVARALAADPPVMLMDEPFGAVDPIRRERLQNEFLRLQAQVRKTVVFVTHDVDEAIKMADRIAILAPGGALAQVGAPDAILAAPASRFVEHFVGADRGLKRLSLARVRDLALSAPLTAELGEMASAVRRRLADAGFRYALLIDAQDRPLGWIGSDELGDDRHLAEADATPGSPLLQPETTLRDALSVMLGSAVQLGVVVDDRDRVLGLISVDAISAVIQALPADPTVEG